MMECPKCGLLQASGAECPACGIVFAKFTALAQTSTTDNEADEGPTWEGAWFPDEEESVPASPVRLVTLLLLLALVTVAAYLEYSRHTEAYAVAENTVLSSPDIQVVLGADRGDELRLGYFFRGQARGRGPSAQGRFLFRVLGPTGEGSALVHLNHHRGRWQAVQVDFLDSRGRTRSLEVQKPNSRPSLPGAAPPSATKAVIEKTDSTQVTEETPSF